jgi:hypothetical protein
VLLAFNNQDLAVIVADFKCIMYIGEFYSFEPKLISTTGPITWIISPVLSGMIDLMFLSVQLMIE